MAIYYFIILFLTLSAWLQGDLYDPVAVYLTWQRSPETTMTVQWISTKDHPDDRLEYQRVGEVAWKPVQGLHTPMPEKYAYWIHQTEIVNLLPDTEYYFRIGADGVRYKFRTMPDKMTTPIRFVVGGDIYHDGIDVVEKMNKQAAKLNPMFALCGGDLAYNDDKPGQFPKLRPRWMDWLISWKKGMVTADGRLIPLIPVIGNHDVKRGFSHQPKNAPFFYSLFAMPGAQGYNVLDFGNYMSLFLLDSGHTHPVRGNQTQWLYQSLKARQTVPLKFAIYHVASFPSYRKFNGTTSTEIRKYWVPLFEQFGIQNAFENHDHTYKRTHPIRNLKYDPSGIVYVGDGAWGVEEPRTPRSPNSTWYLAEAKSSRNIVLVILHDDTRHFIAYDDNGEIIDEFVGKQTSIQPEASL